MMLEAEGLAALPLAPAGVIVSHDQGKRPYQYTVPKQTSPSWIEVAIGLPLTGFILPSWENTREWTKEDKRYPGWWRCRQTRELRKKTKKKPASETVVIGDPVSE
jgi:hypothetical protein